MKTPISTNTDQYDPNPSAMAMVPFVSVDDMMKIVNDIGPAKMIAAIAGYVEEDCFFIEYSKELLLHITRVLHVVLVILHPDSLVCCGDSLNRCNVCGSSVIT